MSLKINTICVSLAAAIFLSGCATSQSRGSVNPNLKKDEPAFFSKSGGTACLVGASIVGLACMGIKDDNKLATCLAAAAAGCAAGMTANYMLDKARANYHTLEDQLAASKAQVEESLKSTQTLKDTSEQTLAADKAEIESIKANVAAGEQRQKALNKKLADMEANLKYMQERLDSDKNTLKEYKQLRDDLYAGKGGKAANNRRQAALKAQELDAQIAEYEKKINALNSEIVEYADATSILKNETKQISI